MAKTPKAIDERLKALDRLMKDGRPRSEIELRAVRRQIEDLRTGHRRDLVWDEAEAQRAINFFPLLRHWKGPLAKKPFELRPWQEHCLIAPLLGWYRERTRAQGGVRRFRQAYIEVPRKNGKTILASGIGNFGLLADQEEGAEVYSAATQREQAKILWRDASKTLSPALRKLVNVTNQAVEFPPLSGTFKPLSKDYGSLDGLNPSVALIDELHAHKDRGIFDVLESAFGSRAQQLLAAITTAGFNKSGICFQQRALVLRILAGAIEHDAYFGFVATIDDGDDWTNPNTWWKANPNLGISINEDTLADLNKTAREEPQAENNFRCKRLDQWVEQAVRWMPMELWHNCAGKHGSAKLEKLLLGRDCYVALDLASTRDLAAMAAVFPPERDAEPWRVLVWFWCPTSAVSKRDQQDRQGYAGWVGKWITATEGTSIDQASIRAHLWKLRKLYRVKLVGFDGWNMDECYQQLLREGWPQDLLLEYPQSFSGYNEPMKRLLGLVRDENLEHGANAVLDWNFENLAVKEDPNGNIRPDKGKSQDKVDGAVAVIMGLGLAIGSWKQAAPTPTYYENNELEIA